MRRRRCLRFGVSLFLGVVAPLAAADTPGEAQRPGGAAHATSLSGATPRAELDPARLALLRRLSEAEAAYRQRGELGRAAATRSRIRTIQQELCINLGPSCWVTPAGPRREGH